MYGFPSRGLTVIGVTGTEGKTTTSNLIYHILHTAGKKVAVISTNGAIINGKEFDTGLHTTTPGGFALQAYLKQARKEKVDYVVLEISSHALDQYRAQGIKFTVGVITNVAHDHLDYHKTWENYVHAKARLLKKAQLAIVNKDDRSYHRLKKYELKHDKKVVTYGFKKDSEVNPHMFPFRTKLLGKFNKYNCLAAIAALRAIRIPDAKIRSGIATYMPPAGRQETVYNKDFKAVIDFATTEYSFDCALPAIHGDAKGRLIHVFGSAGQRDYTKRPMLGKVSAKHADIIILTAEDPRNESPEKIAGEIEAGVTDPSFEHISYERITKNAFVPQKGKKYVMVVPDRQEAIVYAMKIAARNDVVVMTGKGHEKSMNYGRGEQPWDEKEIALMAIRVRNEKK